MNWAPPPHFALAKVDDASESSGLTKTGLAVGTPDYVAPETMTMGMQADGRADLYAVGVMLYQMLTGNVPRGMFTMPSVMLPGTDPRFDAIIAKAMKYDREERYPSAADLRRDLDVIVSTPMVQAGGAPSAAIPMQKPMGKPPQQRAAPVPDPRSKIPDQKSKKPMMIGIGAAAAAVIAFFIFGGKANESREASGVRAASDSATPLSQGATPTSNAKPSSAPVTTPTATSKPNAPAKAVSAPRQGSATALQTLPRQDMSTPKVSPAQSSAALQRAPAPPTPSASKSAPPAMADASANSSADGLKPATTLFPPGQWVKVFTKFEDLPEDHRKPNSGVKFEDGWIRFQPDKPNRLYAVNGLINYGIRARLLRHVEASRTLVSVIRGRHPPEVAGYLLSFPGELYAAKRLEGPVSNPPRFWAVQSPAITLPQRGTEYTLEWSCVGDKLITRFNEQFVKIVTDDTFPSGPGYFTGNTDIRDIEVINLDGLSEAEALRILGVDEKGNDLRALAAKQEQQKAEQAKATDTIAAIPELKTLHEQFVKFQSERVTAPFDADLAKLNTSYLGGLDREIEKEKKAGHLDGVIALEAEKKLIIDKHTLPEDDDQTTAGLKALRKVYRDAFAKLDTTRTANLKTLIDPLTVRLKQLESSLTQQNRVPDAKTVREYREKLGMPPSEAPLAASSKDAPADSAPASKYTQREVAEWVLSIGGAIHIKDGATKRKIVPGEKLPAGQIVIKDIQPVNETTDKWAITDADLTRFAGLTELTQLSFAFCPEVTGTGLASLHKLPTLTQLIVRFTKMDSVNLAKLPDLPKLNRLTINSSVSGDDFAKLPPLKELTEIHLSAATDDNVTSIAARTKLISVHLSLGKLSDEGLAPLKNMKSLEELNIHSNERVTGSGLLHLIGLPKLKSLTTGGAAFEAKNLALVSQLKHVTALRVNGSTVIKEPDECIKQLAALKGQLKQLDIDYAKDVPEVVISTLQKAMGKVPVGVRK